jgi:hypothetical protein
LVESSAAESAETSDCSLVVTSEEAWMDPPGNGRSWRRWKSDDLLDEVTALWSVAKSSLCREGSRCNRNRKTERCSCVARLLSKVFGRRL